MLSPVAFAFASLALLCAPGPTNTLLASAGATIGRKAWRLVLVEAAGYSISVSLLVLFFGPKLANTPNVVLVLKCLVALWLVWTSVNLWQSGGKALRLGEKNEIWERTAPKDRWMRKRIVFVTTLLNPKGLIFAFALMPSADTGIENVLSYLGLLVGLIAIAGTAWMTLGAMISKTGAQPYIKRTSAVVLDIFAAFIIISTF